MCTCNCISSGVALRRLTGRLPPKKWKGEIENLMVERGPSFTIFLSFLLFLIMFPTPYPPHTCAAAFVVFLPVDRASQIVAICAPLRSGITKRFERACNEENKSFRNSLLRAIKLVVLHLSFCLERHGIADGSYLGVLLRDIPALWCKHYWCSRCLCALAWFDGCAQRSLSPSSSPLFFLLTFFCPLFFPNRPRSDETTAVTSTTVDTTVLFDVTTAPVAYQR